MQEYGKTRDKQLGTDDRRNVCRIGGKEKDHMFNAAETPATNKQEHAAWQMWPQKY